MAARFIHFGWDDCYRVQVLRSVGFEVRESQSLDGLRIDLQRDEPVDAVVLSEDEAHQIREAATVVRQNSVAPLILFRRTEGPMDESLFDQVYSSLVPPRQWLMQTARLIARSRSLQQESARLVCEAKMAAETCRWECGRLRSQRRQYTNRKDPWKPDSGPGD